MDNEQLKVRLAEIKDIKSAIVLTIHSSREVSLALTKLDEASHWLKSLMDDTNEH